MTEPVADRHESARLASLTTKTVPRTVSQLKLPVCNEASGRPTIPFFQPMVRELEDGHWYLAEDYAFCERARQCGYRVLADTSLRLWHVGEYAYSWEDAGIDRDRYSTFKYRLI